MCWNYVVISRLCLLIWFQTLPKTWFNPFLWVGRILWLCIILFWTFRLPNFLVVRWFDITFWEWHLIETIYNVMVTCHSSVIITSFFCVFCVVSRIFFEFFWIFFEFSRIFFGKIIKSVFLTRSNFMVLYNISLGIQVSEISSEAMIWYRISQSNIL